jgi:hypothetical protein
VSVSILLVDSRALASASSRRRPTKLVSSAGKLLTESRGAAGHMTE